MVFYQKWLGENPPLLQGKYNVFLESLRHEATLKFQILAMVFIYQKLSELTRKISLTT